MLVKIKFLGNVPKTCLSIYLIIWNLVRRVYYFSYLKPQNNKDALLI